jgi:hypothetical protein
MIFVLHSATLLYHLHFLVRCEPWAREPQQKLPCKTLAEIRDDGVSDWIFHRIYHIKRQCLDNCMPFFFCARMLNFYLRGGGTRGMISTYIIST